MSASKDVLALASLEVDLSSIEPGSTVTVKWRGKPVFIRRRTEDDVKLANSVDISSLRDPQEDAARVKNSEWLVVVGVCTHLGCIPLPNAGDFAHVMVLIMTFLVGLVRDPRLITWRYPLRVSWKTTSCLLVDDSNFATFWMLDLFNSSSK